MCNIPRREEQVLFTLLVKQTSQAMLTPLLMQRASESQQLLCIPLLRGQCPIEQECKREALAELLALAAVGRIEVYFGDESGFWQNPVIARAWQFAGGEIRLLPEKDKRLSVFGLLNRNCEGKFWSSEKTIKSEFVIECLEEWIKAKSDLPRVLVLDNVRIHRFRKMQEKLAEWEEKRFYIFNLPPYSPHLNIIKSSGEG